MAKGTRKKFEGLVIKDKTASKADRKAVAKIVILQSDTTKASSFIDAAFEQINKQFPSAVVRGTITVRQ